VTVSGICVVPFSDGHFRRRVLPFDVSLAAQGVCPIFLSGRMLANYEKQILCVCGPMGTHTILALTLGEESPNAPSFSYYLLATFARLKMKVESIETRVCESFTHNVEDHKSPFGIMYSYGCPVDFFLYNFI
jgi:hypothetical protein